MFTYRIKPMATRKEVRELLRIQAARRLGIPIVLAAFIAFLTIPQEDF